MHYEKLAIPDLVLLTPKVFGDERGFFMETFRQSEFETHCGNYQFVQDNHSKSVQGILRGLHYQYKQPQGKLVRVTQGEVFDVAVDMRKSSPTFGQWVGVTLSEENKQLLWVSIRWDDPQLAIEWPTHGGEPQLSEKDKHGSKFKEAPLFV